MEKPHPPAPSLDATRSVSRLGLAAACTLYPAWSFILDLLGIQAQDSVWERLLVVLPGSLFLFADFFVDRVELPGIPTLRKNWASFLNAANTAVFCGIAVHYFYLTRLNQMHPVFSVGAFIVIFASSAVLNDMRSLLLYSAEVFVLSIWASSSDTTYFRYYFVAAIGTAVFVGTLGTLSRLRVIASEKQARLQLAEQYEMILSTSRLAAIGEMSGGMAHEINTPLTTITMSTSMARDVLQSGQNPSDALPHLEAIEKTTLRIASIVKGLLTFARGDQNESIQPHRVMELLEETMQLCTPRIRSENIVVKLVCAPELGVLCGRVSFGQALINLVNNAIDATESRAERRIQIQAEKDGETIRIRVTDNGTGIPPEIAQKVFQPFFTTKEVGKGTGLGLSITRGLVEGNQGTLTFNSSSEGTTFIITLPAVSVEGPPSTDRRAA